MHLADLEGPPRRGEHPSGDGLVGARHPQHVGLERLHRLVAHEQRAAPVEHAVGDVDLLERTTHVEVHAHEERVALQRHVLCGGVGEHGLGHVRPHAVLQYVLTEHRPCLPQQAASSVTGVGHPAAGDHQTVGDHHGTDVGDDLAIGRDRNGPEPLPCLDGGCETLGVVHLGVGIGPAVAAVDTAGEGCGVLGPETADLDRAVGERHLLGEDLDLGVVEETTVGGEGEPHGGEVAGAVDAGLDRRGHPEPDETEHARRSARDRLAAVAQGEDEFRPVHRRLERQGGAVTADGRAGPGLVGPQAHDGGSRFGDGAGVGSECRRRGGEDSRAAVGGRSGDVGHSDTLSSSRPRSTKWSR